jgi:tRNA (guanine10-N2)-dimethyltransferase
MKSVLILGRHNNIALAELFSLYGENYFKYLTNNIALSSLEPVDFDIDRLGGILKIGRLLTQAETLDWDQIETFITNAIKAQNKKHKVVFGISVYNHQLNPKQILKLSLNIKKRLALLNISSRFVVSDKLELNAAQIINNRLHKAQNYEFLIIKDNNLFRIGQTSMIQNINNYSKRDFKRPYRDSKVGMLPPKLAQIIINLAIGPNFSQKDLVLLDPFCGSGVILQEALLMNVAVIGSDLNPRMVEYSKNNIEWLRKLYKLDSKLTSNIIEGDATNQSWSGFDVVASETLLGPPLSRYPSESELSSILDNMNQLIRAFLYNLKPQLKRSGRVCLALPIWRNGPNQFKALPILDQIEAMGYNFIDFKSINSKQLIYIRDNQIVGRQLLIITKE